MRFWSRNYDKFSIVNCSDIDMNVYTYRCKCVNSIIPKVLVKDSKMKIKIKIKPFKFLMY